MDKTLGLLHAAKKQLQKTNGLWPLGASPVGGSMSTTSGTSTTAAWGLSGSSRALGLGDLEFGNGHWKFDSLGAQHSLGSKLRLKNIGDHWDFKEELLVA